MIVLIVRLHDAPGMVDLTVFTDQEAHLAVLAWSEATSQYPEEGAPIELPLHREQLYNTVSLVHMED